MDQHPDRLFGIPMALVMPLSALLVMAFCMGLGWMLGAFDSAPVNLPARDGLEGTSPFDGIGGGQ